jgi:DNA-binding transcriptional LysR family regulator
MEAIAEAPYVERGYMLESNKPRHMTLNRAGTAFSMEAIATMLLTGTYIGYLPCHYAKRWVDEGELFALAPTAFSYSSVFSVITRQGKELDVTTGLMVESMSVYPNCSGLISSDMSIGGQSGIDEERKLDDKKAPPI